MSEWEQRVGLIRPYLDQYHRRFSVLDLGCGDGQIARAIAREYDAVVTVVEKGLGDTEEYSLSHYQSYSNILCLKHEITLAELERFVQAEHFDVVLCLNFLHWAKEDEWAQMAEVIMRSGDNIFIQVPPADAAGVPGAAFLPRLNQRLNTWVSRLGETVQFPGHYPRPLWYTSNPVRGLRYSTVYNKDGQLAQPRAYPKVMGSNWIPGINLWNWIKLGGVLPTKDRVIEMLDQVEIKGHHGDVVPWNFILDGERVHLIDGYEGWGGDDRVGLDAVKEAVRNA